MSPDVDDIAGGYGDLAACLGVDHQASSSIDTGRQSSKRATSWQLHPHALTERGRHGPIGVQDRQRVIGKHGDATLKRKQIAGDDLATVYVGSVMLGKRRQKSSAAINPSPVDIDAASDHDGPGRSANSGHPVITGSR